MTVVFAWHVHHETLVEPLTEPIENRIAYIRKDKPAGEIELRLRLLKPVRGSLPAGHAKARAGLKAALEEEGAKLAERFSR